MRLVLEVTGFAPLSHERQSSILDLRGSQNLLFAGYLARANQESVRTEGMKILSLLCACVYTCNIRKIKQKILL